MKLIFVFFVGTLVCSTSGSPADSDHALVLRKKRDIDIYGNTRKLIEELVENLRLAGKQAIDAVSTFSAGVREQMVLFGQKVEQRLEFLRERVIGAINNITERFQNISGAVRECIETQKYNATALLNETLISTSACADNQIERISGLMNELANMSDVAVAGANNALVEMHNCSELHQGQFFALGSCLSSVVVQTEIKGAVFAAQSGLMLARINLAMTTLPAALEVCAGARLVEAGSQTTQIVMQVGRCSISSAFSTMIGN